VLIRWFIRLLGTLADAYTLWSPVAKALATGTTLLAGASAATYAIVQLLPWPLILLFLLGGSLVAVGLMGASVKVYRALKNRRAGRTTTPERTGVRTRGGTFRSTGKMRIRKQDRAIDSEGTDWETKDTDIE
jgi:hypothetical protein